MNDGDWICADPNCGNINFARRVSCYRCNKEKPDGGKAFKKKLGTEIGKSAAEKSRGLFNADDWQCNKCANVNWARRHTCNVCNAPKFGEVEARTGYGGGYNERGVVEYRRREPSSDDEYDEFGRKKRKRKHETHDKVGITEGAEFKKLPATMLQKESKLDHIPGPAPKMSHSKYNEQEKISGSLSDGSVCELPPLSKMAFRRHQLPNQTNYHRQDNPFPAYRANNLQARKRYSSIGDRDHTGSSGYETASKKSKRESSDSPVKGFPVMENRVSSTNNDFVYKFQGTTSSSNFQVVYTLEERVRAAAFALVYNNCKITTEKFEWLYDKPAPDFKTIFAWRQRLLSTGCLVDGHMDSKPSEEKNSPKTNTNKQTVTRIPNPDEIAIISSDSEDESTKDQMPNKLSAQQRSVSAETLLIGSNDQEKRPAGSSVSTNCDRRSRGRSCSESSHKRTHSSSSDSQDSNYPDSDSEKVAKSNTSRTVKSNDKKSTSTRPSVRDSDSDSISYDSDDDNFLSRVYGESKKTRRKVKKRAVPPVATKAPNYVTNDQSFQGYSTAKPSVQQSPLVTGNIYTCNLRNMNVRNHDNPTDTDACSSEYIPTKLGSTTKNYQEFKDNVRRKGYWAKGNGAAFRNSIHISNEPITRPVNKSTVNEPITRPINKPTVHNYSTINLPQPKMQQTNGSPNKLENKPIEDRFSTITQITFNEPLKQINRPAKEVYPSIKSDYVAHKTAKEKTEDYTTDDVQSMEIDDQFLPFDKPAQSTPNISIFENTTRIFDVVQSNSTSKNRSIMDIFNMNDKDHDSPERNNDLEKYDGVHKMFETTWDEDDDALYKEDSVDENTQDKQNLSSGDRNPSPVSNMLYATDDERSRQVTPKKNLSDLIESKRDMLLGLLNDFQNTNAKEIEAPIVQQKPPPKSVEPLCIPLELSDEILSMSQENIGNVPLPPDNISQKRINPSKQIHVLESITIPPNTNINWPPSYDGTKEQQYNKPVITLNENKINNLSDDLQNTEIEISTQEPPPQAQPAPTLDLSNLLSGINTNTLLLALQNLQQINQTSSNEKHTGNNQVQADEENDNDDVQHVETINLTNDEDWEKESNRDGSIERELQKLDGNTGDTPFLSDIFDPGPVVMPSNKKLNINLKSAEENKSDVHKLHLNENAPVIGNFKSFALPKPILLNRLKLTVKPPEKAKKSNGKKLKRKKKSKASGSQGEEDGAEDEEEESGDEADLSKYDLWGSDEEQGNSSKAENADKSKEGESSKEGQDDGNTDNNGKTESPVKKNKKRRSRSSSSSSTSSSSSSSSHSSTQAPKNKFDDFNLNSERETSPKGRKSRSRSRSPRAKANSAPARRKSRDSRSAGESRSHDKEYSRDRERRDRPRGNRDERKERRYSREGGNHYGGRGRHR